MENKRLSHALQMLQEAQERRETRPRVRAPSTGHRADGSKVASSKRVSSHPEQAHEAIDPELLPPLPGRQTALQGGLDKGKDRPKADIST